MNEKKLVFLSLFLDILYTAEHRFDKVFSMLFVSDRNCSLKIKYFTFNRIFRKMIFNGCFYLFDSIELFIKQL